MVTTPELVHIGRLALSYDAALLYDTQAGGRAFCKVTMGTVSGPRLNGRVVDDGGDWLVFRSDGTIDTDSRMMIAADDGTLLYMRSRGCIRAPSGAATGFHGDAQRDLAPHPYRCAPYFDAPPGPHAWLSQTLLLGTGTVSRQGCVLELFEVR